MRKNNKTLGARAVAASAKQAGALSLFERAATELEQAAEAHLAVSREAKQIAESHLAVAEDAFSASNQSLTAAEKIRNLVGA